MASGRSSAMPSGGRGVRRASADLVAGPRIYRHHDLPLGPSWDDVRKLIESTASDDPADIRDRAIIMLFAVYGLRAGEVAALRLDDIDWEQDRLTVPRAKQRRRHVYPLVPSVGQAIIRYLKDVRPRCSLRQVFLKVLAPVGPLTSGEPLSDSRRSPEALGD